MREVQLAISQQDGGGWLVEALDAATGASLAPSRTYPSITSARGDFPAGLDAGQIEAALDSIADRTSTNVVPFGQYLFRFLIGDALWTTLTPILRKEPLHLSVLVDAKTRSLSVLPWELMHDGQSFVVQQARLALSRRLRGTDFPLPPISTPPKVLFIVGAKVTDPAIRAGTEYLAFLRGIEYDHSTLATRLLLEATVDEIEAALKRFTPDIVHFIGHGGVKDGVGYIEVAERKGALRPVKLSADALAQSLASRPGGIPPIVVLNACETASSDASASVALGLAEKGVPMVIGMAGRVLDQACRLFTRRFYESLLQDGDVCRAAAEGRRFGLKHALTPESVIDWALPTVFLSGTASASVSLIARPREREWQRVAVTFANGEFPAFCGRHQLWTAYDRLMMSAESQEGVQVLVLRANADDRGQYGKSRFLRELAVQTVRDGHLPVLLPRGDAKSLSLLLEELREECVNVALDFDIPWTPKHGPMIAALAPGAELPEGAHPALIELFNGYSKKADHPGLAAAALRLDLLDLLDAARRTRPDVPPESIKLVLLLDDIHRRGDAVEPWLKYVVGVPGLRVAKDDLRIAMTYSFDPAYQVVLKPIEENLQRGRVAIEPLDEFKDGEDALAYETFLLHWREDGLPHKRLVPLVVDTRQRKKEDIYRSIGKYLVKGIPSRLKSDELIVHVQVRIEEGDLRAANDEEIVAEIQRERGGAP